MRIPVASGREKFLIFSTMVLHLLHSCLTRETLHSKEEDPDDPGSEGEEVGAALTAVRAPRVMEHPADPPRAPKGARSTRSTSGSKKVKLRHSPNSVPGQLGDTFPRHSPGFA